MSNQLTAPAPAMQSPSDIPKRRNPQPAGLLLLWWPVFLSLGIGAFFTAHDIPVWWLGLMGLCIVTVLAGLTWRWRYETIWVWCIHGLFALALGFTVMQLRHASIGTDLLNYPEFNVPVSGVIVDAEQGARNWRIVLDDATVTVPEKISHR